MAIQIHMPHPGLSLPLVLPVFKQIYQHAGKKHWAKNTKSSNFTFKENSLNAADCDLWVIIQSKTNNLEVANSNFAKK